MNSVEMPAEIHAVTRHSIFDRSGNLCFCCKDKEMKHGYVDNRLHNYDELKIVRIERGSCVWNINGTDFEMEAGDLILLNRLDFRYVRTITSVEPMNVCQFCFTSAALFPNQDAARFFFLRPDGFSNRIRSGEVLTKKLTSIFDAILAEIEGNRPFRDEMILNLLVHMVLRIAQTYPDITEAAGGGRNAALIADAVTYIGENHDADLTLPALAARASMSEAHFSRTFKVYSGIGLREYVTRSRVIRVIMLMQANPDRNILDIAFACGFNTSSGFYRAFESVTGTSPRALIRTMAEGSEE